MMGDLTKIVRILPIGCKEHWPEKGVSLSQKPQFFRSRGKYPLHLLMFCVRKGPSEMRLKVTTSRRLSKSLLDTRVRQNWSLCCPLSNCCIWGHEKCDHLKCVSKVENWWWAWIMQGLQRGRRSEIDQSTFGLDWVKFDWVRIVEDKRVNYISFYSAGSRMWKEAQECLGFQ